MLNSLEALVTMSAMTSLKLWSSMVEEVFQGEGVRVHVKGLTRLHHQLFPMAVSWTIQKLN